MSGKVLYSDALIEVSEESILFRNYYYPFGSKPFPVSNIERILYYTPRWWSGKWRIYGSGDLRTWCPLDWKRPSREIMFIVFPTRGWWRVGFTAEDSGKAAGALRDAGIPLKRYRGPGARPGAGDAG